MAPTEAGMVHADTIGGPRLMSGRLRRGDGVASLSRAQRSRNHHLVPSN